MNLVIPSLLAALLAGLGLYGVLARRNAVMVLVGAELLINAGALVLIISDARLTSQHGAGLSGQLGLFSGQVGALFAITIAAAEIGVALAVVLLLFRSRGTTDLAELAGPKASDHPRSGDAVSSKAPR